MKKLLTVLLVGLILVMAMVPVLAATKEDVAKQLAELRIKQLELQKQAVQLQVQAGYLTKEQGDWIIGQLELQEKYLRENPTAFFGPYGPGYGMRGYGPRGGFGGFGGYGCPMHGGIPF